MSLRDTIAIERRKEAAMRKMLVLAVILAALAPLAAAARSGGTVLTADIAKKARISEDGLTAFVRVTVSCPSGSTVLESFVYVTQEGSTSRFAPIPVTCDSKRHTYVVRVPAGDVVFHEGRARASGYVLLSTGESVSPTREIKIRGE